MQLFLNRAITGNPTESINGYMVAPRVDTGRLGPDVAYVGTWELGPDQKHVCGEVSIYFVHMPISLTVMIIGIPNLTACAHLVWCAMLYV